MSRWNSGYREIEKYVCVNSRWNQSCGEGEIEDISDCSGIFFGLFLGGTG